MIIPRYVFVSSPSKNQDVLEVSGSQQDSTADDSDDAEDTSAEDAAKVMCECLTPRGLI